MCFKSYIKIKIYVVFSDNLLIMLNTILKCDANLKFQFTNM